STGAALETGAALGAAGTLVGGAALGGAALFCARSAGLTSFAAGFALFAVARFAILAAGRGAAFWRGGFAFFGSFFLPALATPCGALRRAGYSRLAQECLSSVFLGGT